MNFGKEKQVKPRTKVSVRNVVILSISFSILLLVACNQKPGVVNTGSLVRVDLSFDNLQDSLNTQAIPFEGGSAVVSYFEIQVFDANDALVMFDSENVIDPAGATDTLTVALNDSIEVALTTGDYSFKSKAYAPNKAGGAEVVLAVGTDSATVNVDTTSIGLGVKTISESFTFQPSAPLNYIIPGQTLDMMLVVSAPGGYIVPLADYDVSYTIDMDNVAESIESVRGVRLVMKDPLVDNDFSVVATVSGTSALGTIDTLAPIDGVAGIPFLTSGIDLVFDTEAPSYSFVEPSLTAGVVANLTGTASDIIGIDKVQVYDGPVLIGSSDSSEAVGAVAVISFSGNDWSMSFTPEERSYALYGVAYDTSGNQTDTTYTVDAVTPPPSAPPVVTLSNPLNGHNADFSDAISFSGSATDPEDGALTGAALVWTSDIDGELGTGESFTSNTLSAGAHTITLTATDSEGLSASESVTLNVAKAVLSMPVDLSIPYTESATLPIQLVDIVAPTGGITFDVSFSVDGIVQAQGSSLTIPEGEIAANLTLDGIATGTTVVSVSNPNVELKQTNIAVTASLNIVENSVNFSNSFPKEITVQLRSSGNPVAAPVGGIAVNFTAVDPDCVEAADITILEGLASATASLTYAGNATLPCNTTVSANSPNIDSDSLQATVSQAAGITVSAAANLGVGLQTSMSFNLGASNHGGVDVTVTSSSPGILLTTDPNVVGSSSIVVSVNDNSTSSGTFYMQGVSLTDDVVITASHPAFTSGTDMVDVVASVLDFATLSYSTTSLSNNRNIQIRTLVSTGGTQRVSAAAGPLTVNFNSSDASVVELIPTSVTIPVNQTTGTIVADPLAAGTATITATTTAPNFTVLDNVGVTVTAPGITVSAPNNVNAGSERPMSFTLGAPNHGGVDVTVSSSASGVALLSTSSSGTGSASITISVADGQTNSGTFYLQGVSGAAGNVVITASSPAFIDGSDTIDVIP